MKFKNIVLLTVAFFSLAACQNTDNEAEQVEQLESLVVASTHPPMTHIIEFTQNIPHINEKIKLLTTKDNIAYNTAVVSGEAHVNLGQHLGFLKSYNEENKTNLIPLAPIYTSRVGFYSPHSPYISKPQDIIGGQVAIPEDPFNQARALYLLEQYDAISIKGDDPLNYRIEDIEYNPQHFRFEAMPLADLSKAYLDGYDLVFNYPTYMNAAQLKPDDIFMEEKDPHHFFAYYLVTSPEWAEDELVLEYQNLLEDKLTQNFIKKIGHDKIKPLN